MAVEPPFCVFKVQAKQGAAPTAAQPATAEAAAQPSRGCVPSTSHPQTAAAARGACALPPAPLSGRALPSEAPFAYPLIQRAQPGVAHGYFMRLYQGSKLPRLYLDDRSYL